MIYAFRNVDVYQPARKVTFPGSPCPVIIDNVPDLPTPRERRAPYLHNRTVGFKTMMVLFKDIRSTRAGRGFFTSSTPPDTSRGARRPPRPGNVASVSGPARSLVPMESSTPVSALRVGATLKANVVKPLGLAGTWSVWSQAADCPGAYFIVPANVVARAMDIKFAVIKATLPRMAVEALLDLVRTDPPRPDLMKLKEKYR